MEFREERMGPALVLGLEGRLDSMTSDGFGRGLESRIDAGETWIVLDMGGLQFISSAGLRVLLLGAKKLRAAGGGLTVCALNDMVREILELSGFLSFISVYDDPAKAVAGISGQ